MIYALFLALLPQTATAPATRPLVYSGGMTCAVSVSDLERSRAWYRDVLGLKPLLELPEMGWCEFATPIEGVNLGLMQVDEAQGSGGTTLSFGVFDIELTAERLKAARVETSPIETVEGLVHLMEFADPDGNRFQAYQVIGDVDPRLGPVAFLAGTWRNERGGTIQEERWTRPEGGAMFGLGRTMAQGSTPFFELLRIEAREPGIVYVAAPKGQDETPFWMIHSEKHKVVFENPEHDFPQRITYWLAEDGRLHALIEGAAETGRKADFVWSRTGGEAVPQ